MNVGRVRISAVPQLMDKGGRAAPKYRTHIVWVERNVSFMMPVAHETAEDAIMKGVAMLDWLKETYGEDYDLAQD